MHTRLSVFLKKTKKQKTLTSQFLHLPAPSLQPYEESTVNTSDLLEYFKPLRQAYCEGDHAVDPTVKGRFGQESTSA